MRLPKILKQFLLQSVCWTVICFAIELVCRKVFRYPFPYDYPFTPGWQKFVDFKVYIAPYRYFHSQAFFTSGHPPMYPAPGMAFYRLFVISDLSKNIEPSLIFYLAAILVTGAVLLVLLTRALIRHNLRPASALSFIAVLGFCSFPFWFDFHQGNVEFILWIFLTAGIMAHWRGQSWLAAACFGIATALKIFPFIFFGLLLIRRQYRQIAFGVAVAAVATVVSLWLLCPDIAYSWRASNAAVASMRPQSMLVLWPIQSGFDHSLFCLFKRCFHVLPPLATMDRYLNIYFAIVVPAGCALYWFRIRKLPVVNQILCLTVASILFPPVSYDYNLLELYAPLTLLVYVALSRPSDRSKPLLAAFSLFAFLLAPQSEFILHGLRMAGQLKAIALLALFAVALVYRFEPAPGATLPQPIKT
jgi:hypothetical protein